jgi:hypothetical protein
MAYADYRLCDQCGEKAFYDANLNYEISTRKDPILGHECIEDMPGVKLDYLGSWKVLCRDCAKTHEIIIAIKD